MTYTNFPVYIGRANSYINSRSFDIVNYMILANRVSVDVSTSRVNKRRLGVWVNQEDQFSYNADKKVTINIEFNLKPKIRPGQSGDLVYSFLYDDEYISSNLKGNNNGQNYFPIRIGKTVFNRCFLQSYSIQIEPNSPVRVNASFSSMFYTNANTRVENRPPYEIYDENLDGKDLIYGNTCELIGDFSQLVTEDIFATMTYNKTFQREHLYQPHQDRSIQNQMQSITTSLSIDAVDLTNMVFNRGIQLNNDLVISFKNNKGERILENLKPYEVTIKSGAKLNQNGFEVVGGDSLKSKIIIEEVLF